MSLNLKKSNINVLMSAGILGEFICEFKGNRLYSTYTFVACQPQSRHILAVYFGC